MFVILSEGLNKLKSFKVEKSRDENLVNYGGEGCDEDGGVGDGGDIGGSRVNCATENTYFAIRDC